ncbi:MAG: TetR family transcriptional regulator [Hellea sp.]|nr:TetR family transcriptional regulator [Hellea sp.]
MRRQPKQVRAQITRQRLMNALDSLLKERDFDLISVVEIAKEAGVSSGLLYSHFKNKADFLDALLEDYQARIVARLETVEQSDLMAEFKAAGGLREALREIAAFAYQQLSEDAHILRAIAHSLKSRSALEREDWQDIRLRAYDTIAPVLTVYETELARPNDETTAQMLVYFFNSIYLEELYRDPFQSMADDIGKDRFISEIADFAYGYLTTPR